MLCFMGPESSAGTESACKAGDLGSTDMLDNTIRKISAYYFKPPKTNLNSLILISLSFASFFTLFMKHILFPLGKNKQSKAK